MTATCESGAATQRDFAVHLPTARAQRETRPIVAALEGSSARETAQTAARLARRLDAPLTFVYLRRGARGTSGEPCRDAQLNRELQRGRHALDVALAAAARAGVMAHGEIVTGDAPGRILEFALDRQAWLLVVAAGPDAAPPAPHRPCGRHACA
jgi:nucleotide-binding universal stress UspA family protein